MIVGIDPGLTGAIGVLSDGGQFIAVHDMPVKKLIKKRNQLNASVLAKMLRDINPSVVFLEHVHPMPHDGSMQAFSFGCGYGIIQGVLETLEIPYSFSSPQKWKKTAGLIGKDKDAARLLAQQLFSEASLTRKKDIGRADALLIAKFG